MTSATVARGPAFSSSQPQGLRLGTQDLLQSLDPREPSPRARVGHVSLDLLFKRAFGDQQSTRFGSGWASGVLAVFAGSLALGGLLCFRFPEWLTTPAFRSHYSIPILRRIVQLLLVVSFISAALSLSLRRRKVLGITGMALCLVASLLGGSSIPLADRVEARMGLGLDWFLLNRL